MTGETTIDGFMGDTGKLDDRPLIDPETGWNHLMVEQMANSVTFAHDLNPSSYAIYRVQGGALVLAVESFAVLTIAPDSQSGDVLLKGEHSDEPFADIEQSFVRISNYKQFPGFLVRCPANDWLRVLQTHRTNHEEAIRWAASRVKTRSTWAHKHAPDVVIELEQELGRGLPRPEYGARLHQGEVSPPPHVPTSAKRYWKISPGQDAIHWNQFRDKSVIAVHWLDEPKDLRLLPGDKPQFVKVVNSYPDATPKSANALWEFGHDIKPGDGVLAYGNRAILGSGTVTGEYESVQDDFPFHHRRNVKWDNVEVRSATNLSDPLQRKLARNAAVVELTENEFQQAAEKKLAVQASNVHHAVQMHFALNGLHYTDAQVATFYTALQTKGFVVLSGISGTGKSKIAQTFVNMLPLPDVPSDMAIGSAGFMSVAVKPYMKKSRRIVIPTKYYELLTPMERGQSYTLTVTIDGQQGTGRLWFRVHGGHDQYLLSCHQSLAAKIDNWKLEEQIYLDPVLSADGEGVAEFRISNVPPVLQTDGAVEIQAERKTRVSNHLFLSVRPDWRDSTSLLGYFNPLTQTYEWTDFLRFILRAVESYHAKDGLAWFVILDEMNLAHVEYYFADLLSVLESGRQVTGDDAGFTREPLRTTYPDTLDDEVPPREIYLPPNLYVIGTVNMDETTHAFSPKVLDRAFTIELTDVSFEHYPPVGTTVGAANLPESDKQALLAAFTRDGRFHQIDKAEVALAVADHPELRTRLENLNRLLMKDRFHFGYRIFDEICQYVVNNDLNRMMKFEDAFDAAVFMKVLPKFSGSRSRLRNPLISVLAWAIDPAMPLAKQTVEEFETHLTGKSEALKMRVDGAVVPSVAKRALEMLERVELDGFVSFG